MSGFGPERRVSIPLDQAEKAAEILGLRLTPKKWKMFLGCVQTIINDDIDRANQANQANQK